MYQPSPQNRAAWENDLCGKGKPPILLTFDNTKSSEDTTINSLRDHGPRRDPILHAEILRLILGHFQ